MGKKRRERVLEAVGRLVESEWCKPSANNESRTRWLKAYAAKQIGFLQRETAKTKCRGYENQRWRRESKFISSDAWQKNNNTQRVVVKEAKMRQPGFSRVLRMLCTRHS